MECPGGGDLVLKVHGDLAPRLGGHEDLFHTFIPVDVGFALGDEADADGERGEAGAREREYEQPHVLGAERGDRLGGPGARAVLAQARLSSRAEPVSRLGRSDAPR